MFRDLAEDPDTVICGVDPGVDKVFVAVDGEPGESHRIRQLTAAEYYDICGYNRARQVRTKYLNEDPTSKSIIDRIPSLKTSSLANLQEAIQYRLTHHRAICTVYHQYFQLI